MKPNLTFLTLAAALLLVNVTAKAQSLSQTVIGVAGNEMLTPDLAFSYTVGEPCVTAWLSQQPIFTEGFQQNTVTITHVELTPFAVDLNVFPNPFSESFTVEFNHVSDPSLVVTDALGRTVNVSIDYNAGNALVHTHDLPSGAYMLNVLHNDETVAAYRVIKAQ